MPPHFVSSGPLGGPVIFEGQQKQGIRVVPYFPVMLGFCSVFPVVESVGLGLEKPVRAIWLFPKSLYQSYCSEFSGASRLLVI